MIVFPVRIIMSPTSSSIPFAGRKARSATVRTTLLPSCGDAPQWATAPKRVWVAFALAGLALAGCGSERQDADEPEGEFTLEVVEATFPERQTTAQHAVMRIAVRNTYDRDLPNLAVTIATEGGGAGDP